MTTPTGPARETREATIIRLYLDGLTMQQVAAQVGVRSADTVRRTLAAAGVKRRRPGQREPRGKLRLDATAMSGIDFLAEDDFVTVDEVATALGVTKSAVYKWVRTGRIAKGQGRLRMGDVRRLIADQQPNAARQRGDQGLAGV